MHLDPSTAVAHPSPSLATVRTILLALIAGMVTFAAAACTIPIEAAIDPQLARVLVLVLVVLGAVELPVWLVLRAATLRRLRERRVAAAEEVRRGGLPRELAAFTIVGAALAEGFGLYGCTVLFLTGDVTLLAAPALATGLIALQLPSRGRIDALLHQVTKRAT